MYIVPLGGAEEIGASSTIIDFQSVRVLVDAGIRPGKMGKFALPDFKQIKENAGTIDAIFITHAHLDHVGALPLIHMAFPECPIYMTPATFSILQILLMDSEHLMNQKWKIQGEIPHYPPTAIASCLGKVRPVHFNSPLQLFQNELLVSFHPAGHILGASSIAFQSKVGSILVSGDISVSEQRTIPGLLPPMFRPDVVMVESTYGDSLHAHRPSQEKKFIEMIAETIESKGKILIPAFAIGRAQEILLILQNAFEKKELPLFPVFVDGMVKSVCHSYNQFPSYLQQQLQKNKTGHHIFFPSNGNFYPIENSHQRKQVLEQESCCIVSSSGMLTGGPSAFYAKEMVEESRNLIAITGYQDEESPGKHLLQMTSQTATPHTIQLFGKKQQIKSKFEKYSLSAHADGGEIASMISTLSPSQGIVLVHGEQKAREALGNQINPFVSSDIFLPSNNEKLEFNKKAAQKIYFKKQTETQPFISPLGETLDSENISFLHQTLWVESQNKGSFSVEDLLYRWYGAQHSIQEAEKETLLGLLQQKPSLFQPEIKRKNYFRLLSPAPSLPSPQKKSPLKDFFEMVHHYFSAEDGLYKKGANQENKELLLFFQFPHVAQKKHQSTFLQIEKETGWTVVINEHPHLSSLEEEVRRLLPAHTTLAKNPSILHEQQTVKIVLLQSEKTLDPLIKSHFLEKTGYQLEIAWKEKEKNIPTTTTEGKREINQTFSLIEQAFLDKPHVPHKKSQKKGTIVLSFISPSIGQLYSETLKKLSVETGWDFAINPSVNHHQIKQEIRLLCLPFEALQKEPSVHPEKNKAIVRLQTILTQQQEDDLIKKTHEITGLHLEIQRSHEK